MVPMPCVCCAAAAAIASSSRSPGMKVDTDRRTNAVLVACSRSHALVDSARRSFRAMDIGGFRDCEVLMADCYSTPLISPPSTCTDAPVM